MKKVIISLLCCACLVPSILLAANKLTLNYKITGIQEARLKNALARLQAAQGDMLLNKDEIEGLYQQGAKNIRQALQPYGYFKASILTQQLTHDGPQWTASYHVTEVSL